MTGSEVIVARNTGNVPIDYGFAFSDPGPWSPSFNPGADRCVLRIRLDDNPIPPLLFSFAHDYVKEMLTWAINDYFGPNGENVLPPPHSLLDVTDNIWMQWVSPTYNTVAGVYDRDLTLTVQMWARYHMP